jgi:hypothetical protein
MGVPKQNSTKQPQEQKPQPSSQRQAKTAGRDLERKGQTGERSPEEAYPDESSKRTDPHDKLDDETNPNRQGARHSDKDEGESSTG